MPKITDSGPVRITGVTTLKLAHMHTLLHAHVYDCLNPLLHEFATEKCLKNFQN